MALTLPDRPHAQRARPGTSAAETLAEPSAGAQSERPIDAIIDHQAVHTLFQPVIHLATASTAGFEALSRGPVGTDLESPQALLAAAQQVGRLGELDWLCRARAMQAAADAGLPESLSWLINVEPAGLASACPEHLIPVLERARAELRIILEVVERDMQGSVLDLIRASDQARRDAWGVALDDVGAEEGSLALLPFLRPDVVKLDMSLIQGVPHDAVATITGAVRAYAERTGAVILAEGIETQEQECLAKVFGATYGQGYYYGRPGPLPASLEVPTHPIPLAQYVEPLDGRTPFEVLAAKVQPQRADKRQLLHIGAYLEDWAGQAAHASVLLAGFQKKEYFSPAQRARYDHLATSNALTIVLGDGLDGHDEPTYHVGPRPPGSRVGAEWVVIVVNPHFAAAFVARDARPAAGEGKRQFDFIYTYDRDAVIDAGRAFLQDLAAVHEEVTPANPAIAELAAAVDGVGRGRPVDRLAGPATALVGSDSAVTEPVTRALELVAGRGGGAGGSHGFRATSQVVLDCLNAWMPMAFWSVTRVENGRQTFIYVDENELGLKVGDSTPWQDTYCVHMLAGTAPRIAPDAAAIPAYAAAPVNQTVQIGAYAGAPISEPDGSTFGVLCGVDQVPREDLAGFGPVLDAFSELLTISLATDRALNAARIASSVALTFATTDSLTSIHNRRAWDDTIHRLESDYSTYVDPTVIVIVDLDNLKAVNDGPGGHTAGDRLLRTAVNVMRRSIRENDFLARLGGDEFGIILTQTPADLAPGIVNRLTRVLDRAGTPASVGWSALAPTCTVAQAVELADRAMYTAKHRRKKRAPAR